MPKRVEPMLCTLLKKPFNDPKYLYEVKWDGYRIIAYKDENSVSLETRNGLNYAKKYPSIVNALSKLADNVVLDGEVVVLDAEGRPDFQALQNFNGGQAGVYYYVFDILWRDGKNLMGLPLTDRKEILHNVVRKNTTIRYSDHFDDGIELFKQIEALGLEGIVAKRRESFYLPAKRGRDWCKISATKKQEFVIGGWVESESRHFRTLLFGVFEGKRLKWVGHAGSGYKEREMPIILKRLKALEIKTNPFVNEVDYDGIAHWVKPELVANIKYATLTRSGKIRKPAIFLGFREDKAATQVVAERAASIRQIVNKVNNGRRITGGSDSNWPEVERQPIRNKDTVTIENCKLT